LNPLSGDFKNISDDLFPVLFPLWALALAGKKDFILVAPRQIGIAFARCFDDLCD